MRLAHWPVVIGAGALAASALAGLGVHGVRTERMGFARSEQLSVESLGDVFRAAVWETRVALADFTWLEAEVVFHRGVRHADQLGRRPSPLRPWVPEHVHDLDGVSDMMPWVWLTTTLNPQHARAYAMGGYFLSWQLSHSDTALEYLAEGAENNPQDPMIPFTVGKIHLLHRHDPAAAVPHLTRALEIGFPQTEDGLEEELAAVRMLAHALRLTGNWEQGLALWQERAAMHTDDPAFQAGLEIYIDLVSDEERRETYDLPELRDADAAAMASALCSFAGPDHDHEDDEHAH